MKPIPEMTDAELDEAMAVEVRGWMKSIPPMVGLYQYPSSDGTHTVYSWQPSTDLNQAWECADEMNKRGWILELGYEYRGVRPNGLPMQYRAYADDDKQWLEALSESPARAVCEALLMAARSNRE